MKKIIKGLKALIGFPYYVYKSYQKIENIDQKIKKIDQGVLIDQKIKKINQGVLEELAWANIYHDTIRSRKELMELALHPRSFAVGYNFLYVLLRMLVDYRPQRIFESGLGESTKLIETILKTELLDATHIVVEEEPTWLEFFNRNFTVSERCEQLVLRETFEDIIGFRYRAYENLEKSVLGIFDLYVIDGPRGSDRYSRYGICPLLLRLSVGDEFVILQDDSEREGERDTASAILASFKEKGICVFTATYSGMSNLLVICTEKYKYMTTL